MAYSKRFCIILSDTFAHKCTQTNSAAKRYLFLSSIVITSFVVLVICELYDTAQGIDIYN